MHTIVSLYQMVRVLKFTLENKLDSDYPKMDQDLSYKLNIFLI